jgi:hypothetical protein
LGRFLLHSCFLRFPHPITQEAVDIEAPVPEEFSRFEVVRQALRRQPRLKRLLFDEPDWNEVL